MEGTPAVETVDPTCTADGSRSSITRCSVCGFIMESVSGEVLPATGHRFVPMAAEEATCQHAGHEAGEQCSVCNEWKVAPAVTPKKDHKAGEAARENEVPASCSAEGSYDLVVRCTVCSEVISNEHGIITKLDHTYGIPVSEVKISPTCTTTGTGETVEYCTECRYRHTMTESEIANLGHDMEAHEYAAATCSKDGSAEYYFCKRCEKYFADRYGSGEIDRNELVIPKHTQAHHEAVAATCTTSGNSEYWSCNGCGKYYSDEGCLTQISYNSWTIGALGHTMTDHPQVYPTCTENGHYAYYSCSTCRGLFTDEEGNIPTTHYDVTIETYGHTKEYSAPVEATCSSGGSTGYWFCIVCEKYFSDSGCITEIGKDSWLTRRHEQFHYDAVESTCTTKGNYEYWQCRVCGKYHSDEACLNEIAAGDWLLDEIPACDCTESDGKYTAEITENRSTISSDTVTAMKYEASADSSVTLRIDTKAGMIELDNTAVKNLKDGDAAITLEKDTSGRYESLTGPGATVFEIAIGDNHDNFNGGKIKVTVPYSGPTDGMRLYCVSEGKLIEPKTVDFTVANYASFELDHLSTYSIQKSVEQDNEGDEDNNPGDDNGSVNGEGDGNGMNIGIVVAVIAAVLAVAGIGIYLKIRTSARNQ